MDTLIKVPSKQTLEKYGLTAEEWLSILEKQGNKCPICRKVPSTGRFVIDHLHVRGYKKLPSDERKKLVRGILCWVDNNRLLSKGVTIEKLENAIEYLKKFTPP